MDTASSVAIAPGYTLPELILGAISTINDGNGVDIDGISKSIKERYTVKPNFRRQLKHKLKKLVFLNKIEKVENRYKILAGAATEATNPTQTLNPQDSTKPQDLPNTCISSEEMLKIIDGSVKVVAVAEHIEFQAKEAFEVADRADQVLNESIILLELACEIFHRCNVLSKGEKIFLR